MSKRLISFSLYGDKLIYLEGALANVHCVQQYLPSFIARFYYDDTVPENYIEDLRKQSNTELINMSASQLPKMIWRFLAADDKEVALFFSFDTDSRIGEMEAVIIEQLLQSDKQFLVVKDHPVYHVQPLMMGGMWGMKNISPFSMEDLAEAWFRKRRESNLEKYNEDQIFLREVIYPKAKESLLYIDEFNTNGIPDAKPLPVKRQNYHFVGEAFNEDNSRRNEYKALRTYYLSRKGLFWKWWIRVYDFLDIKVFNRSKHQYIER